MANASKKGKGMGGGAVVGHPNLGTTDPNLIDEDDLANHMKGNNSLQGNDQGRVRNQRLTMPGAQDLRNQPESDGAAREVGAAGGSDREAKRS
jgi:hypothetical protein